MKIDLKALSGINLPFLSYFNSKDILGVDIGSYSVKVVQLRNAHDKWSLVMSSTLRIPEEITSQEVNPAEKKAVISSLIKNYIMQEKISVRNTAISVSGASVVVRYVKFPKISKEDLTKSIQFEAEPYIPFDIKDVNLGFYILGEITDEGQKKTDTVLVAAKKDIIQEKIDIVSDAGLNPVIIDVDAFALESSYEINKDPEKQEMAIIINIGANTTNVAVIEKGISRVVRDIFIGGNVLTKALQKNFQCDYKTAEEMKINSGILVTAEDKELALKEDKKGALQVSNILTPLVRDLVAEVHRSIDFFYSQRGEQQALDTALLVGGCSRLKNLDKYFSQELKLQTKLFNPLEKVEKSSRITDDKIQDLGIAVGLATRKVKEE